MLKTLLLRTGSNVNVPVLVHAWHRLTSLLPIHPAVHYSVPTKSESLLHRNALRVRWSATRWLARRRHRERYVVWTFITFHLNEGPVLRGDARADLKKHNRSVACAAEYFRRRALFIGGCRWRPSNYSSPWGKSLVSLVVHSWNRGQEAIDWCMVDAAQCYILINVAMYDHNSGDSKGGQCARPGLRPFLFLAMRSTPGVLFGIT